MRITFIEYNIDICVLHRRRRRRGRREDAIIEWNIT